MVESELYVRVVWKIWRGKMKYSVLWWCNSFLQLETCSEDRLQDIIESYGEKAIFCADKIEEE